MKRPARDVRGGAFRPGRPGPCFCRSGNYNNGHGRDGSDASFWTSRTTTIYHMDIAIICGLGEEVLGTIRQGGI